MPLTPGTVDRIINEVKIDTDKAVNFVKSPKFNSSKLFIAVGAIALLVMLRKFDINDLTNNVMSIASLFLVLRTIETGIINVMNGLIEVSRVKAGKDDGAPAAVGDSITTTVIK